MAYTDSKCDISNGKQHGGNKKAYLDDGNDTTVVEMA